MQGNQSVHRVESEIGLRIAGAAVQNQLGGTGPKGRHWQALRKTQATCLRTSPLGNDKV